MRHTSDAVRFIRSLAVAASLALAIPALAQNNALDEQTFEEFEQIVADFSTAERIQAWEAFLQKYPSSSYVPKVKQIIAELRGEKKAGGSSVSVAPTPRPSDPDLDFLADAPGEEVAKPTPRPIATQKPRATPTPAPANPFMDTGTGRPRNTGNGGSNTSEFSWNDRPQATPTPAFASNDFGDRGPRGPAGPAITRPPRRSGGVGKATHTEVALTIGFAPDETYVRNYLVGMTATQRFGRTWGASVEAWGAQNQETPLLRNLRNLGAEPEVISKYNWIAGGAAEANLLSAIDAVTGQIPNRNDLYVRAGGGIVNTDLEICKEEGGQPCAAPLFIEGVNFGYASAGVGHRFYVTRWLTLRSEVRGRAVMELIDGKMTPRSNIQVNLGPTFVF